MTLPSGEGGRAKRGRKRSFPLRYRWFARFLPGERPLPSFGKTQAFLPKSTFPCLRACARRKATFGRSFNTPPNQNSRTTEQSRESKSNPHSAGAGEGLRLAGGPLPHSLLLFFFFLFFLFLLLFLLLFLFLGFFGFQKTQSVFFDIFVISGKRGLNSAPAAPEAPYTSRNAPCRTGA